MLIFCSAKNYFTGNKNLVLYLKKGTKMKTITLKQIGYYFRGVATINLWGGGQGEVTMSPWEFKGEFDRQKMLAGINDGEFGCEGIKSATVTIFEMYEHGYKKWIEVEEITKYEELLNVKRGI